MTAYYLNDDTRLDDSDVPDDPHTTTYRLDLEAEKATEDAVCPECHGARRIEHAPEGYTRSRATYGCPRCKGAGRIEKETA